MTPFELKTCGVGPGLTLWCWPFCCWWTEHRLLQICVRPCCSRRPGNRTEPHCETGCWAHRAGSHHQPLARAPACPWRRLNRTWNTWAPGRFWRSWVCAQSCACVLTFAQNEQYVNLSRHGQTNWVAHLQAHQHFIFIGSPAADLPSNL